MAKLFRAGVMEGHKIVWWSSHRSMQLAEVAARKYARDNPNRTGGAGAWSGYVRRPDGTITELQRIHS